MNDDEGDATEAADEVAERGVVLAAVAELDIVAETEVDHAAVVDNFGDFGFDFLLIAGFDG